MRSLLVVKIFVLFMIVIKNGFTNIKKVGVKWMSVCCTVGGQVDIGLLYRR